MGLWTKDCSMKLMISVFSIALLLLCGFAVANKAKPKWTRMLPSNVTLKVMSNESTGRADVYFC